MTNKCEQCGGYATNTEYLCEECLIKFHEQEYLDYLKSEADDYERCIDCSVYLDSTILRYCNGCHAPICVECDRDFSGFCRECWSERWRNKKS